jgi:hypothetical protein
MIFFGSVSGSYFSVGSDPEPDPVSDPTCIFVTYYSYSIHIMKRYKLFMEFFVDKKKHIFLN